MLFARSIAGVAVAVAHAGDGVVAFPALSPDAETLAWWRVDGDRQVLETAPASDPDVATAVFETQGALLRPPRWNGPETLTFVLGDHEDDWRAWRVRDGVATPYPHEEGERVVALGRDHVFGAAPEGRRERVDAIAVSDFERTGVWSGPRHDLYVVDPTGPRVEAGLRYRYYRHELIADQVSRTDLYALGSGRRRRVHRAWNNLPGWPVAGEHAVLSRFTSGADVLFRDGRDTDRTALVAIDARTGARRVVWEPPKGAALDVWLDPETQAALAVGYVFERLRWHALDERVAGDLAVLDQLFDRTFRVSGGASDRRWLVSTWAPHDGGAWHLYDRAAQSATPLSPPYDGPALRPTVATSFVSRDGLELVAYVTRPDPGIHGEGPHPFVMRVHGGPWCCRDHWGEEDETAQRWARRGWGTLVVEFRGSFGFGRSFTEASIGEWGGRMLDDLEDGFAWAVGKGWAEPGRLAMVGDSYGGEAVLETALSKPDLVTCGSAAFAAGSQLRYAPGGDLRYASLGGRALRRSRSAAEHVDRLSIPLILFSGEDDRQVPFEQVRVFAERAAAAGGFPFTWAVWPDQGHGPATWEEWTAREAIEDAFLAGCLGGDPPEDLADALRASSVEIRVGARHVPGLEAALQARP